MIFGSKITSCRVTFHQVCSSRWLQPKRNRLHVHMQMQGSNQSLFSFLLIILFLLIFKGSDLFKLLPRTPSSLKYKESKFVLSQTMLNLTKFIKKSINIYHIKYVDYEIIFHNLFSGANLMS